ncbi:hypothetical protein FALBO_4806 [Fusarium albosuccineum]|uniref:Uncharacterized protein n=1 Tax=Fusarium albosuccineum TaxID=1237068 RepID=A0A8H4LHP4_9HYPO|nr:hypothetical protein FALBO_4806 [Fusarium albosuccineum]
MWPIPRITQCTHRQPSLLALFRLPSSPRQAAVHSLDSPQSCLHYHALLPHSINLGFDDTSGTKRYLVNLLPSASTALRSPSSYRAPFCCPVILKQRLHRHSSTYSPAPAQQAPVTCPMPEAPSEANTFISSVYELSADPADGEIEKGCVTWRAGETR